LHVPNHPEVILLDQDGRELVRTVPKSDACAPNRISERTHIYKLKLLPAKCEGYSGLAPRRYCKKA
jgi:hypothetical protein